MEKTLYESIAMCLMERYSNGKEVDKSIKQFYSIPNREEIQKVVDKMKKDSNRYFHTHYEFKNPNDELINKFMSHEAILFNNFLKEFDKYIQFDVEMLKFGNIFSGTRKRWALINFPNGIYTLGEPLFKNPQFTPNFEEAVKKGKDKTEWLKKSKINFEDRSRESKEWIVADKNHRIILAPSNHSKSGEKLPLYFYFENLEKVKKFLFQREKVGKLFKLLKCKKLHDEQTNFAIKNMINMIEVSYMYFSAIKIIEIKNSVLFRKANLNSKKNYVNSLFTQFQYIGEKILFNFDENYRKVNLAHSEPLFEGRRRISIISLNHQNRKKQSVKLSFLKNCVEKIIHSFPLIFKKKESYLKQTIDIGVFKIVKCSVDDVLNSIVIMMNKFIESNQFSKKSVYKYKLLSF